jgi:lysophospholipase L1-like esterase
MNPVVRHLLMVGGGPRSERLIRSKLRQRAAAGRVAGFLGDSITNGSSASNSIYAWPRQTIALTDPLQFSYAGSVYAGVPGETSAQILARLPAILAQGVNVLFIMAGTNDAGAGVPSATFGANMAAIFSACQSANVRCFVSTVIGRGAAVATAGTRTLTTEYNAWIAANAASYGAHVFDSYVATKEAGGDLDATYDSGDGIHPNNLGHRRIAHAAAAKALQVMALQAGLVTETSGVNLVPNPLMNGAGSQPTGYFEQPGGTGTAPTYSIVNDSSGFLEAGRWAQMAFNAVSGGSRIFAAALGTGWSVGDTLAVTGRVQMVDNGGNWEAVSAAVTGAVSIKAANQAGSAISGDANNATAGFLSGSTYNIPSWVTFTVPVGTTSLLLYCTCTLPAGANVSFRFGAMGVINLTRLRMAAQFP